ncbi:murein transglycosylase A [Candidatus Bandiella euplotis]|uniref:peptidoglycan lytic exotransglycosylase n=1 Tax=Candidatus Bandiella euplotis TaxID=1664265 RepID=A0ABZ0UKU3_9RICK|nr:MltA domain-containing protein [Candidatus Bandiella woodruffii]WPX96731.1 Membrane-bound lytic murein transglycosylase A [Candidatus Bandiella woodruffii]
MKKILLLFLLLAICSCSSEYKKRRYSVREARFAKVEYHEILGWNADHHLVSLNTFANSCKAIMQKKGGSAISGLTSLGGKADSWKVICENLQKNKITTNTEARKFFERWFTPYKVLDSQNSALGKFTGYYEIELNGHIQKTNKYKYPVYAPPPNLTEHKGRSHLSHTAINNGSLRGKNLEFVWVDNHAKLKFMHIQGSGRIKLATGQLMRVGYAGQNGFEYKSIGPYFKEYNAKNVNSALDMMEWIERNPKIGKKIMGKNQSYVFFRKIDGPGPIGAQGIALTPERSVAIDRGIYPYGTPTWVDTYLPSTRNYLQRHYRRLLIAQDTGGAIKGAIRGDIFFGHGSRAEEMACYLNKKGKMYVLFPKNVNVPSFYRTS